MAAVRQQANQETGSVKEETMNTYFRITAYSPEYDASMILDAYGRYEKKWQFSSELVKLGLKILEVCDIANVTDTDIQPVPSPIPGKICLRAGQDGEISTQHNADGILVSVGGKHYTINLEA